MERRLGKERRELVWCGKSPWIGLARHGTDCRLGMKGLVRRIGRVGFGLVWFGFSAACVNPWLWFP